jgi:hypothetical protein
MKPFELVQDAISITAGRGAISDNAFMNQPKPDRLAGLGTGSETEAAVELLQPGKSIVSNQVSLGDFCLAGLTHRGATKSATSNS